MIRASMQLPRRKTSKNSWIHKEIRPVISALLTVPPLRQKRSTYRTFFTLKHVLEGHRSAGLHVLRHCLSIRTGVMPDAVRRNVRRSSMPAAIDALLVQRSTS